MSDLLNDKTPIRARHIRPGQGQAVEVKAGQLLQIQTVQGKQVADFVAFSQDDTGEYVSTSATRATNANIIPQLGMTLYSNRRQPMFEIVEDTVGRHDMIMPACDGRRFLDHYGVPDHPSCRDNLTTALAEFNIPFDRLPDPFNFFMHTAILGRGELEVRESLSEAGDFIVLRALTELVLAVSACPHDRSAQNGREPSDLLVRVFRN